MKKTFTLLSFWAFCLGLLATNPVVIGNQRFTFITDNLVRMEYAQKGNFLNDPTLFAYNRQLNYSNVTVEHKGSNKYVLSTPAMRVVFTNDGFPISQTNLKVYFKDKSTGKEKSWYIASEQSQNLRGALITLDGVGERVPLQEGLLSRDGWYLINDTGKEILKNGWVAQRSRDHVQDLYLFVYGNDYKAALKSLRTISDPVPMPRKYILGSWYCRWWDYTADDYRELVKGYKEHDFPLDIMVMDMGWHTQDAKVGTGHAGNKGWCGYSWNRKLIPDPAQLIKEFKDDNVYVVLNEHPHDGLRPHEDAYPAFIKELGVDTANAKVPLFDAGDRNYMDAFLKYAHKESEDMGVAFWWLDWQQDYLYPLVRGTNMTHLAWLNELFYKHSQKNNQRGAGFSRWAGWGDHRHPIQFSGDAVGNWDVLRFQIEMTATSGNAGCFFWAHDVGGFYDGKDAELYTRWTQFALLNSSLRIHSVYDKDLDRRPWLWGEQAEKAMRRIYHMRSEMMPYIYSSVHQCYTDMLPLIRSMYIDYPDAEKSYSNPQQFMFGDLLLGAPVTQAGTGKDKIASQQVWLPEGDSWYNMFTGKMYEGGQTITEQCPLDAFPLYAKGGYPIPMQPYTPRMASTPLSELVVRCYPGLDGRTYSYTLYEDDGLTMDYQKGKSAETKMTYNRKGKAVQISIDPVKGTYEGQLQKRSYRLELPLSGKVKQVKVNGKSLKVVYDEQLKGIVVKTAKYPIRQGLQIVVG